MIQDFIVSVLSSVVASFITGFSTNKLIGKDNSDISTKIYVIYVSLTAFISLLMFAYMINTNIVKLISKMANVNVFTIYKYSSTAFVWIFLFFTVFTIIFLILRKWKTNNSNNANAYSMHYENADKEEKCGKNQ